MGRTDLHNGELVPAKARDHVGISNALAQPACDRLEEKIADGMPVCIVDVFEAIKIEAEYSYLLSSFQPGQRLAQLLVKPRSIGQISQRIVVRHISNLCLSSSPLGNVIMSGNPATGTHGRISHQNLTPVRRFEDRSHDLTLRHRRREIRAIVLKVLMHEFASLGPIPK